MAVKTYTYPQRVTDIVSGSFVVHAPTTVDELELAVQDQLAYDLFDLVVLLVPPALEESLLYVDKLAVRIVY